MLMFSRLFLLLLIFALVYIFKKVKNHKLIATSFWLIAVGWSIKMGLGLSPSPLNRKNYLLNLMNFQRNEKSNCGWNTSFSEVIRGSLLRKLGGNQNLALEGTYIFPCFGGADIEWGSHDDREVLWLFVLWISDRVLGAILEHKDSVRYIKKGNYWYYFFKNHLAETTFVKGHFCTSKIVRCSVYRTLK